MMKQPGVWERRRLDAMQRIQRVALDRFDGCGFTNVTVEEVAKDAAVSPSSVYRYFGTKEAIVLWDDHDRGLMTNIASSLGRGTTLGTVKDALSSIAEQVDALNGEDQSFLRRRLSYVRVEPSIWQAVQRRSDAMVAELSATLADSDVRDQGSLERHVVASAIASAVLTSILHWAEEERTSLATLFDRAFRALDQGLRL